MAEKNQNKWPSAYYVLGTVLGTRGKAQRTKEIKTPLCVKLGFQVPLYHVCCLSEWLNFLTSKIATISLECILWWLPIRQILSLLHPHGEILPSPSQRRGSCLFASSLPLFPSELLATASTTFLSKCISHCATSLIQILNYSHSPKGGNPNS